MYAFVPFVVFLVLNTIIIFHIKRRANMHSDLSHVSHRDGQETLVDREDRRVTLMLIAVTVAFLIQQCLACT